MNNLLTIAALRQTALDALAGLRGLSPRDQLAPLWAAVRQKEVGDCLTILDRDAATLPSPKEREAARRAAVEVRDDRRHSCPT